MKKLSLNDISKATNVSVATLRFWGNHYDVGEVHSKDHFNTQHIKNKLGMIENITELLGIDSLVDLEIVKSTERVKKELELIIGEKYLIGYGDNTKAVELTNVFYGASTYIEYKDGEGKYSITTLTAFERTARGGEQ